VPLHRLQQLPLPTTTIAQPVLELLMAKATDGRQVQLRSEEQSLMKTMLKDQQRLQLHRPVHHRMLRPRRRLSAENLPAAPLGLHPGPRLVVQRRMTRQRRNVTLWPNSRMRRRPQGNRQLLRPQLPRQRHLRQLLCGPCCRQ